MKIIFVLKTTQPLLFRLCLTAFFFFATCICKPMQQNSPVPLKPCHLMTSHQERILLVVSSFRSLRQCDHKKVVKKILSLFNMILSFGTKPFLVIIVSFNTVYELTRCLFPEVKDPIACSSCRLCYIGKSEDMLHKNTLAHSRYKKRKNTDS